MDKKNESKIKKGRIVKLIISFMPMIVMMVIIYLFSAKNGMQSSHTSGGTVSIMITFFEKIPGIHITQVQQVKLARCMELPVRKLAHITEYGILLATIYIPVEKNFMLKNSKKAIISVAIAILYAASDELHQRFVPGRSGRVTDVLIDSIGILVSLFILQIIYQKKRKCNMQNGMTD